MSLTKDQIRHVAKLANLPLTDEELSKYSQQLSKVLDYMELLEKIDTSSVEPTFNTTGLENVMQEDIESKSFTQDEALANPSVKRNGFFVTKGVFNE